MSGILIIGAGGHAKVIADILLCQGTPVIGFVDDNATLWGTMCLNLPIFGPIETYQHYAPDGLIVGIGQNSLRKKIVEQLGDAAASLWVCAVHPRAIVAGSARLGAGSVVMAGAIINPEATVGQHAIINTGATVDHDCQIGSYCHIAPGSHLAGRVSVGEGSLVGIGSAVLPQTTIGRWAVIGAGSVIVDPIPDGVTAKGVPARWNEDRTG